MAASDWALQPQTEEDALHNVARLLNIESRPYLKISGRLLKPDTFKNARPLQLPSPPLDASAADEQAAAHAAAKEQQTQKIQAWRDDLMNEFAVFDFAVNRFESTANSNQEERERYAEEKNSISDKQQSVKDNIEKLRVRLEESKERLAVRKTYDELAEKITNSKMLRPRDEQALAHAKLDEEITELENEVKASKDTWNERRIQFGRIEQEARGMLRMIKDEKEEAERKEGMMKDDADEPEGSIARGDISHAGTPRPDGNATPMHVSQTAEASDSLKVPQDRLSRLSRDPSIAPSPARSEILEDAEMADSKDNSGDARADDSSEMEEGEEEDD